MKKNAFTLIELLAVIAMIAIIAVITYPVIGEIIGTSEKNTFKTSVEELINITKMDYNEYARSGETKYTLSPEGKLMYGTTEIKYNGKISNNGNGYIYINNGKATKGIIENDYYKAELYKNEEIKVEKKE